nr:hypothetical protein [uncultured Oscillibacter sp.]
MRYAATLKDIPNAFDPLALSMQELARFYYNGTMPARTKDKYVSPIEDIYEDCIGQSVHNTFLLLGNRGCGKSTELNAMSARLMKEGFPVVTVECGYNLNLKDPVYTDLLFLMGEALLSVAKDKGCTLANKTENIIRNFWADVESTTTITKGSDLGVEFGISTETPPPVSLILKLIGTIKTELKANTEIRTTCREQIKKHLGDWINALNQIATSIAQKLNGKRPIIIFEDLDKLHSTEVWKVFYEDASKLAGFKFPVIYTFPSAFSYDPRFQMLELYFIPKKFPMIQLEQIDGTTYEKGYEAIIKIIEKRANPALFNEDALRLLIQKTGGSLRNLFTTINASFKRANRRKSNIIQGEDVEWALKDFRDSLTIQIDSESYVFLANICRGNHQQIEDRKMLLEMLQKGIVLEHDGWYNVHPLIVDFLKDQGLICYD